MKSYRATLVLTSVVALLVVATSQLALSAPADQGFNINVVDSFRKAHPLLMGCFNLGGILLLVGVCASALSIGGKSPRGR